MKFTLKKLALGAALALGTLCLLYTSNQKLVNFYHD